MILYLRSYERGKGLVAGKAFEHMLGDKTVAAAVTVPEIADEIV
jgi:hypothetical protein